MIGLDTELLTFFHENLGHKLYVIEEPGLPQPAPKESESKGIIFPVQHGACCNLTTSILPMVWVCSPDQGMVFDQHNLPIVFPSVSEAFNFLYGFHQYVQLMIDVYDPNIKVSQSLASSAKDPSSWKYFLREDLNRLTINLRTKGMSNPKSFHKWSSEAPAIEMWSMEPIKVVKSLLAFSWMCKTLKMDHGGLRHVEPTTFDHESLWKSKGANGHLSMYFGFIIPHNIPSDLEGVAMTPPITVLQSKPTSVSDWGNVLTDYNGKKLTAVDLVFEHDHNNCMLCGDTQYVLDTGVIQNKVLEITEDL